MRRRSMGVRLVIMAVIALLLGQLGGWPWAGPWWLAYAVLQFAVLQTERRVRQWGPVPLYGVSFLNFTLAGAPAWHLWTHCGVLGVAAATMFLCGMLAQLVASSLAARRLFVVSAAPLVAYLLIVPSLAFGVDHWREALTILACGLALVGYLAVLWRGQQEVLESVERSRAEAEAANRAKTEFLATMSHEIRTPMNAVLAGADLLGRTELSADQREHVEMLQDGGLVLMQVLNDVLDLGKIEAGKLAITRTTVDVHSLVRRCAAFWGPRMQDAGLEMVIEIAPDAPRFLELDAIRTGQILFNLLANTVKFTAHGSVTLSAEAIPDGPDAVQLALSVRDTGIGIAPEALARLFTPFEQADSSITRRFGGTGLGLAIAQRLAGLMGGDITASSAAGEGSTFRLRLPAPLAAKPSSAQDAEAAASAAPAAVDYTATLRVLVAEDNPANQRIIAHFLRPLGAEVTMVDNGLQAVEALGVAAYDVVLMDMQMPVMDGLEATRRVRAGGGPNARVPILALTANVMEAHREACEAAGMSGHIAKPIDARALLSSVVNAGAISAAQRAETDAA